MEVDPWPFAPSQLSIELPARVIEDRPYDAAESASAFAEAAVRTVRCRLRRRTPRPPRSPRSRPCGALHRVPERHQLDPCRRSAGIMPHLRSLAASMAAMPKRVASTRSKAVGVPPRWMWPSTVARVSKPVRCSISRSSSWPMPPSRAWPNSSSSPLDGLHRALRRDARPRPPRRSRSSARVVAALDQPADLARCRTGCSGIRITSAPPAMPECRAIQPAWRPITSTTMHAVVATRRWCAGGRSPRWRSAPRCRSRRCSRCAPRSLSIVFGHADDVSRVVVRAGGRRRACPRRRSRSAPSRPSSSSVLARCARRRRRALNGLVREVPRIVPPRGRMPRIGSRSSCVVVALERPAPAVAEADRSRGRSGRRPCGRSRGSPR